MHQLIARPPSDPALADFLATLATDTAPQPELSAFPDIVYLNYPSLGLSLHYTPRNGYKPTPGIVRDQLPDDHLQLDAIDIYNVPSVSRSPFASYPRLPIQLPLAGPTITIAHDTTGRELVSWLGEPSRKGGGTGPSSGSIHIWCEWSQHGIMVEFAGCEARGPQAWERGADAIWNVVTLFAACPC